MTFIKTFPSEKAHRSLSNGVLFFCSINSLLSVKLSGAKMPVVELCQSLYKYSMAAEEYFA